MNNYRPLGFFLLLFFSMTIDGFVASAYAVGVVSPDNPVVSNTLNDFEQYGYYSFRKDLRKCSSPMCGGIFIKAVNRKLTRCPDGRLQLECYVGTIKNHKGIDLTHAALLRGFVKPTTFFGFGLFELKSAFKPATNRIGKGQYVGLEGNGLVCITSPCFSYNQYSLNSDMFYVISGLDLSSVNATDKVLQAAWSRVGSGQVIIAAGYNKKVAELGGAGITFFANQFYLPINPVGK